MSQQEMKASKDILMGQRRCETNDDAVQKGY